MTSSTLLRMGAGPLSATIHPVGARLQALEWRSGDIRLPLIVPFPGDPTDDPYYMGATIGRFTSRIAGAGFKDGNRRYRLTQNEYNAALHGGVRGFSHCTWDVVEASDELVCCRLVSPDGDQGFPGQLECTVSYALRDDSLRIEFAAQCDQRTPINLTNHAYFNLGTDVDASFQHLMVAADEYLGLDTALQATGERYSVNGVPLDFRQFQSIKTVLNKLKEERAGLASRSRLNDGEDPVSDQSTGAEAPGGIDTCYVLQGQGFRRAACLRSDAIEMELWTDQAALQVYTGHHLRAPLTPFAGVCLEAQGFPDTPNQRHFPGGWLEPGECYQRIIELRFSRR